MDCKKGEFKEEIKKGGKAMRMNMKTKKIQKPYILMSVIFVVLAVLVSLILTGMTEITYAEPVKDSRVWADDRDGDGWITNSSRDTIGLNWSADPFGEVFNMEFYADGTLIHGSSGVNLIGITWVQTELFGINNEIHIWYGEKVIGYTMAHINLPILASEFPLYPSPAALEAIIDINPNTLNLKSKGKYFTCYIELPEGYNAKDIDLSSILLENYDRPHESSIGDYDENGILELRLKFKKSTLKEWIEPGDEVEISVSGQLYNGIQFEGSDVIRVITKGKH
jgi:hypothetical protein